MLELQRSSGQIARFCSRQLAETQMHCYKSTRLLKSVALLFAAHPESWQEIRADWNFMLAAVGERGQALASCAGFLQSIAEGRLSVASRV